MHSEKGPLLPLGYVDSRGSGLQSKHVLPSALGCAGLGQDDLGCKDQISPVPIPSVCDAEPQHPGPAVDMDIAVKSFSKPGTWLHI